MILETFTSFMKLIHNKLKPEFSYTQNLIDVRPTDIPVFKVLIKELNEERLNYALTFTNPNPIYILVVDEASQIATKDHLTVINFY
jgi:hypothetical protein